jgi:hypothetical protein
MYLVDYGGPMYPLPKLGPVLTVDDFLPYVGATYRVETVPKPVDIRLDELRRGRGEPWMVREPFALVFSTPWTVMLLEAQYQMQPIGGKPVPVYLIPTQSPPGDRRLYHAVFN